MNPQNKPVSSLTWVLISAAGFLVFIGVALFFIFFNDKLSNISLPLYFFLLVVVGLIAAAFLSGALKSQAKYSGKVAGGTLDLAGPVVIFALIIYLGYIFRPVAGVTSLKITVFGSNTKSELINAGMLKILLNKPDSQNIHNGLAEFTDIPTSFTGKEVTVIPLVDGYYDVSQQVKINADDIPVELHLTKKPDSVFISGIVINQAGKAVSNAIIIFEDGFARDTSDNYGNFRLKLPFKEGHESRIRVYLNNVMMYNNEQTLSSNTSMTLQLHK
ncbi:MAG TPA: hypothetical protein VIJ92_13760 [Ginsengibacter sp.]